jgi:cell division control protein 45
MAYKMKPVSGYDDLFKANEEDIKDNAELRSVVLINCGGIVDMADFFDLPEAATAYVVDSHRPYHLANVDADNTKICMLDDGDGDYAGKP